MHAKSHVVPVQTGTAFGGVLHGAHVPLQERVPALHVSAHTPEREQLAVAFGAVGHGLQLAPQDSTAALLRH